MQLKPRSVGSQEAVASSRSNKPSPFGAAKPREEVLISKGIDPTTIDSKIAKKAARSHLAFTKVCYYKQCVTIGNSLDYQAKNDRLYLSHSFRNKSNKLKRSELNSS
jgi:hypothetical protein